MTDLDALIAEWEDAKRTYSGAPVTEVEVALEIAGDGLVSELRAAVGREQQLRARFEVAFEALARVKQAADAFLIAPSVETEFRLAGACHDADAYVPTNAASSAAPEGTPRGRIVHRDPDDDSGFHNPWATPEGKR